MSKYKKNPDLRIRNRIGEFHVNRIEYKDISDFLTYEINTVLCFNDRRQFNCQKKRRS